MFFAKKDPEEEAEKERARARHEQLLAQAVRALERDKELYAGHTFVHGSMPTWTQFSFVDLFADPFVDLERRDVEMDAIMGISKKRAAAARAERALAASGSSKDCKPEKGRQGRRQGRKGGSRGNEAVVQLAMSMKFVGNIFKRLLTEDIGDCSRHVSNILQALQEALQIGSYWRGEDVHGSFLAFLQYMVGRVNAMRPGEILIFPGGWRRETKPGHALVHVLEEASNHHFTFSTCNTKGGEGLEYHARAQCAPPKLRRSLTLCCDDVPVWRLQDSSFWYMLFRPLVYPSDANGPAYLYEQLLPYLNSRPLYSNAYKHELVNVPQNMGDMAPTKEEVDMTPLPSGISDATPDQMWGGSSSSLSFDSGGGTTSSVPAPSSIAKFRWFTPEF